MTSLHEAFAIALAEANRTKINEKYLDFLRLMAKGMSRFDTHDKLYLNFLNFIVPFTVSEKNAAAGPMTCALYKKVHSAFERFFGQS
jgi:hypothetical protein